MSIFYNEAISAVYHHGSRIILNSEWHDKNVICPNSKIYYVIEGELCVEVGNNKLIAKSGDAIVIPAGIKHSYHLTELEYAEKYWFHFDLRVGQRNFFDTVNVPYLKYLGTDNGIEALFDAVVNTDGSTPAASLSVASLLINIISLYTKGAEPTDAKKEASDETDKVIAYVKKNYQDRHTLESLADMARLAPNYFAKKFKEKTGHPPLKYVNILRIERAKFLLEHTSLSISAIMEDVGFLDSAHFSKLFKLGTGYSPSKFRRALSSRKSE